MKKLRKYILAAALFLFLSQSLVIGQILPKLGAQRAGISALTFLKIDPSARSSAMGGAQISLNGDGFATYWNPAAVNELNDLTIAASNTFWAGGINHSFLSGSALTKFGNIGVSVTSLTTGSMKRRTEWAPDGTGEYFAASNTAVGFTYAKRLTDWFSMGATLKYVNETLAEFSAHAVVVDLGFLYKTDWKDLNFAVVLQNFGSNSRLSGDYQSEDPNDPEISLESYPAPTLFKLGVSMIPWRTDDYSLTVALQLNHPNDGAENIRIGTQFDYRDLLFFRLGYKINVSDQTLPTAGMGIRTRIGSNPLIFDYGVDPTRYLGWIHRIGLTFILNKETR